MMMINQIEAIYYASRDNREKKQKQQKSILEVERQDTRGQSFETVLLSYVQQMKGEKR